MFIVTTGDPFPPVIVATYHEGYNDLELRERKPHKKVELTEDLKADALRAKILNVLKARLNELRQEKNYSVINSDADSTVDNVKEDMRREIDNEIKHEKARLDQINSFIAKINEIELQSKKM